MRRVICTVLIAVHLLALTGCVAGVPTPADGSAAPSHVQMVEPYAQVKEEGIWRIVNASEYLSLRVSPDTKSDRVKKLLPGARVLVLEESGEFSHVRDEAGESGYVLTSYLARESESLPDENSGYAVHGDEYVVIAEEYVSLRLYPDVRAERVSALPAGTRLTLLSKEGVFARVRVENSHSEGYVLLNYIAPGGEARIPPPPSEPKELTGDIFIVAAQNYLSLRSMPNGYADRIKKLYPGTRVQLLGVEGEFAHVQEEGTGDSGYVLVHRLVTELEYVADNTPLMEIKIRYADVVEFLSLRVLPDSQTESIKNILPGEELSVLGVRGRFAHVRTKEGLEGYVLEEYLSDEKPAPVEEQYIVLAKEFVSLRESAATTAKKLAELPAGSAVTLEGFEGMFARVSAFGQTGYVLSGYIAPMKGDKYLEGLDVVKPAHEYSYESMRRDLDSLTGKYGGITVGSIGTTVHGRDIPVAVLGNPGAKHHVLVQAAMHGREHMTAALVMAQIEYCLKYSSEKYKGESVSALFEQVCFHIIPMVNPDGVTISQQRPEDAALRAIYERDLSAGVTDLSYKEYLAGWKANGLGVDINRNFNAGWNALASRDSPSSSHYKGSEAGDQPETHALSWYAKKFDFDATISYHAYGSVIYWDYIADEKVRASSKSLAQAVRSVTRYTLASPAGVDAGGFKDWAMAARSVASITIEIGARECPLPEDEFYSIWQRNRDVLLAVATWVIDGGVE